MRTSGNPSFTPWNSKPKLPLARAMFALVCAMPFSGHALYDPAPVYVLDAVEGVWQGTLQCRDYRPPHKRVTPPTGVYVAAVSPKEVALHYVFNDGPAKPLRLSLAPMAGRTIRGGK